MSPAAQKWASTAERAGRAFAVAFVSVYVMSGLSVKTFSDASLLEKAADAGLAALGSIILSLVGGNVGNTSTPSLLPCRVDPATKPAAEPSTVVRHYWQAATTGYDPANAGPPAPAIDHHLGLSGPRGHWPSEPALEVPLPLIPSVEDLYDVTAPPAGPHPRYKLGRLQNHDERSRAFPLPDLDGAAAIVGKRWTRRVPTFDQGQVGSCTGNAAAGWIGTDDTTRQGLTVIAQTGHPIDEQLALEIYSAAEDIDGDGPYPPNDNGSSGLSVAKVLKQHGWCASYSHAFSIGAVATALQTGPGLLGIPWYRSMYKPAPDGRIAVDLGSGLDGGHEIVIDELEVLPDKSRRYWIQNSWGDGWGVDHGRAYFTEADLVTLLGKGGDFTVPVAAVAPGPPAPSGDDASFLAALDSARPGLAAWVAAKAAAKHESAVTYAAGLLAGIGHVK